MSWTPADFEKLGAFYLGKPVEGDGVLLYDSRDLVTHAVCVGMTGSGKTGLCLALLEEAAMDGIPAIIIDPKGDLGNLLLTFPELRAEDFRPWIVEDDALRKGVTPDEWASKQAGTWRDGLAAWGQDGKRIAALKEKADFAIYTPGSSAGIPVNLVDAFHAPEDGLDDEALAERVLTAVAGLLGFLGMDADPSKSREGAFLGAVFQAEWRAGQDLSLAGLIGKIQQPPFEKVGVLDLEAFYPAKERFSLVLALNTLLASPGFAAWNVGEPLDVSRFLRCEDGRPRHAIFSIAHLDDSQRMFFVSLLLNEVVSWMRRQSGTTSLRAIVYMDEIFGYLPPVANPPSKLPMLTLLKQARAFGVGVVLATQNPVDLDYKALANTGTWFIGRLQTDRDKARVVEGMLGAAPHLSRADLEKLIAGLGSRRFLLNNVHEDGPVVFESRWVMSYLRGPLTRDQIKILMSGRARPVASSGHTVQEAKGGGLPAIPPGISQVFLRGDGTLRPRLVGAAQVRFSDAKSGIQETREVVFAAEFPTGPGGVDWAAAEDPGAGIGEFVSTAPGEAVYAELPASASVQKNYAGWAKEFQRWLADTQTFDVLKCAEMGLRAEAAESRADFVARVELAQREKRDERVEALRKKYAPKIAAIEARLVRARAAVQNQKDQAKSATFSTAISVGTTILGAFLGRKALSATTLNRAGTAARGASRAMQEGADVATAQESLALVEAEKLRVEEEFAAETNAASANVGPAQIEVTALRPARGGISVQFFGLGWV